MQHKAEECDFYSTAATVAKLIYNYDIMVM